MSPFVIGPGFPARSNIGAASSAASGRVGTPPKALLATPGLAQVLQSSANRLGGQGWWDTNLCMRPEDKEPFVAAVRQQQTGLSKALFNIGAGVDDALCALPHLVEDGWKGYIAPSAERDRTGETTGSYFRASMAARGSAVADLGQLAFDMTTPGIMQRSMTGTTSLEAARGRASADIARDLAAGVVDNPLRAAGAVATGAVAGKLPVARVVAGSRSGWVPPMRSAPAAPAMRPGAPAVTMAPRPRTGAAAATPLALEIAAKRRAVAWEASNGGHSIGRHGPEVPMQALKDRVISGFAPDGIWSPQHYSGRFASYRDMMDTHDAALKALKARGVDLTRPPGATELRAHDLIIDHGRAIDDGFVAPPAAVKRTIAASPTGAGKAWDRADAVSGVTATFTKVAWNDTARKWQTVQHFPLVKGWDQTTQSYPGGLPQ